MPVKYESFPRRPEKLPKMPPRNAKFSPPSSLHSGFTPFFVSSKAFDEDSYLRNLTTPLPRKPTTSSTTTTSTSTVEMIKYYPTTPRKYFTYDKLKSTTKPPKSIDLYTPPRKYFTYDNDKVKTPTKPPKNIDFNTPPRKYFTYDKVISPTKPPKSIDLYKPPKYQYNVKQIQTIKPKANALEDYDLKDENMNGFMDNWDSFETVFNNGGFEFEKEKKKEPIKSKIGSKDFVSERTVFPEKDLRYEEWDRKLNKKQRIKNTQFISNNLKYAPKKIMVNNDKKVTRYDNNVQLDLTERSGFMDSRPFTIPIQENYFNDNTNWPESNGYMKKGNISGNDHRFPKK